MAAISTGASTAGKANVDANFNLTVNLPTNVVQAGFVQNAFVISPSLPRVNRISYEGVSYYSEMRQLYDISFNGTSAAWRGKLGTNATTMAKAATNGFMRLNSGSITTTATGISIYSDRVVNLERGYEIKVKTTIRHNNAGVANKVFEVGLGYYGFAAGQAAAMNEFIGFRWGTTGNLQGVVSSSTGGAGVEQTVNINGGVALSDNITREYEIVINQEQVEFWIDGVFQATLANAVDTYSVTKSIGYPWIARLANVGVPAFAPIFDIGGVSIFKIGADDGVPATYRASSMGKGSLHAQPDLLAAAGLTHNFPASGTAPTAATGSNAASVLNNTAQMGGFYRMNAASIVATAHSLVFISGFQNPAIPVAAGAGNSGRNFYVTAITVSPQVCTTAFTAGGHVAEWFVAIGATALSSATADADGTTAVSQKAYRVAPLSRVTSFAAAAAAGTIETGQGDFTTVFPTPLVVHPGEFLSIGLRSLFVTAAATAGTCDGGVYVNGYWD